MSKIRSDALRRQIADDIITGRIGPGVRLDEQGLADRFGVSRTPVREALKHLAAIGLVETRPHKGVVVASVTERDLSDMFEVMALIEADCARFSAQRMTPLERRQLEQVHRQSAALVRGGDPAEYEEVNTRFHGLIYTGSHNRFLEDQALAVRSRLAPFRRGQFRILGRLSRSFAEHGQVVEAILRGDSDAAHAAMAAHVALVGTASLEYVAIGDGTVRALPGR